VSTETAAAPAALVTRSNRWAWVRDYGVYVALGAIFVYNAIFTPNFITLGNANTQLVQVAPVVIVSLGMALVIGSEGVDLSVGSVMAIAAALLPLYLGYGFGVALLLAIVAGALAGLGNGVLVAFVDVQPIVATLALLVGGRGLALVLADGQLKQIKNPTLLSLGNSDLTIILIAGVLSLTVGFLVRSTTFGRHLVAVGGNRTASRLAGLPVRRVLVLVYVASGALAAIAGVLATARSQASDPSSVGLLIELAAITAVVVGGTPLSGGRVKVLGTVMGALLMQLITATLIKHNLPSSTTQIAQAGIILLAVYVQRGRGGGS